MALRCRMPDLSSVCWQWQRFESFSTATLYDILAARAAVFVVEQCCAYQDVDGLDMNAWHLTGRVEGELAAYLRLMPPGERFATPSLGRVMTSQQFRGIGLGRELLLRGIRYAQEQYPKQKLKISAQAHLQGLYTSVGFLTTSGVYLEDDIPHVEMMLEI